MAWENVPRINKIPYTAGLTKGVIPGDGGGVMSVCRTRERGPWERRTEGDGRAVIEKDGEVEE